MFEGKCASGVELIRKGKTLNISARQEVVLWGGAINSPKLLELSGVGQAELLRQHNIPLITDLPGVGENLHDHWNSYVKRSVDKGSTYYAESKPAAMLKNLLRYIFRREGFLANPAALVAVFYKALDNAEREDAQIHFAPGASNADENGNLVPIDGITIAACGTRPESRGSCHIKSSAAKNPPAINVNYLHTEHDQKVAVESFKKVREIMSREAMNNYGGTELEPGNHIKSDTEILEYIRDTGEPVHHLAGSCKMGQDSGAVVDTQLRVHGLAGLRVADASIMPEIVSGNTHAACVMIAEKAADFILNNIDTQD